MKESKIKYISPNVSYSDKQDEFVLVVSPPSEKWQILTLRIWVAAWIFCGATFIYFLMTSGDKEFKLGMGILLVFWVVFLLKVMRALSWRTKGYEKITINADCIKMGKYFGKRGLPKSIPTHTISEWGSNQLDEKSFAGIFQSSFWIIGGEKLFIRALGKDMIFGCQVSEKEEKGILKLLSQKIPQFQKKAEQLAD